LFKFKIDKGRSGVGIETNNLNHIFSVSSGCSVRLGGCCGYQKDTGEYGKNPFQRNKLSFIICNLQAFSHISQKRKGKPLAGLPSYSTENESVERFQFFVDGIEIGHAVFRFH